MKRFQIALSLALLAVPLRAANPAAWEMNSYRDFLAGRFSGVSLTRDGRLTLAPKLETLFASGQPAIWSVARTPDGTLYAGTGHRGRVYRIDGPGRSSLFWTAEQPEVFALAVDPKGTLYAATSPDGKIYRFDNGKAQEYFAPKAKYIWALLFAPDGTLYAGTGDQGRVFRIEGAGKGEVYYDSGQSHITSLALDSAGRLLAGSEPNGIVYRIAAKGKAFVLYDASLPEIRALAPAPDGSVYAAAMGGSLTRRAVSVPAAAPSGAGTPGVPSISTSITVTDEAAQGGAEIKPKPDPSKQAAVAAPAQAGTAVAAGAAAEVAGVEKSALYRIAPDNTVETLWTSKEENVYDLALAGGQLLFSTDAQGRIYRLGPDRKLALVVQTNEGETTRLLAAAGGGLLAATGDTGKVYRLGETPGASGSYESPVHDAGTVARWGRLAWRGEADGGLVFRTRCGNSARPDNTWSEWSAPLTDAKGSPIPSPNARYIQWKAEFTASAAGPPVLDSVTAAYLPQNTAPVIRGIGVTMQVGPVGTGKTAAAPLATYSITVTDTAEAPPPTSTGTSTQSLARPTAEQVVVSWQAEDAEGDRLVYTLHFRGEDEREWKLLKSNLQESSYAFDADVLADGKYFFRVTASDSPSNPASQARESELVSAPALIDHTPPLVVLGLARRAGGNVEIDVEATDAASVLRRCEYSIDAGAWRPLEPLDGVIDSSSEKFVLRLENLAPGEHLVVVRAYDAANNAGLAKIVVRR